MADDIIQAWHFTGPRLRDGRDLPPDGEWLVHEGPIKMCSLGLHASRRVIDALEYAPGTTICRVSCRVVDAEEQDDKLVCRERRIDWRLENADAVLRAFARKAALSVIHLWDASDIVREYLETSDESIRGAAQVAAQAVWSAQAAAWAATRDAWGTAWAATRDAIQATDAARLAAELPNFNALLEQMIMEEHKRRTAA